VRCAGLMGDAALYMTILYCLAFAPFLLPAAIDVGDLTATPYEVMRVLVITASLASSVVLAHVVLGSFQWSKAQGVHETFVLFFPSEDGQNS